MLDLEHRTERLLMAILQSMVNAATYMGNIPQACHYAAIARENGADMGIFDAVARYGFRHKEKMAGELLEQMIADDTWEGLLIKGQNLLNDWLADMDDPDKDARMAEYADMLSKYYDEHSDAEESYEILGLVLMNYFLRNGMSFFDDNLIDYLEEGMTTRHHRASLLERFRIMGKHYGWASTLAYHAWFVVRAIIKK